MAKLKEFTVKKGYLNKDTIKTRNGSYRSVETQAEVILTYAVDESENEDVALKTASDKARERAKDLLDDDADWIKDKGGEQNGTQTL